MAWPLAAAAVCLTLAVRPAIARRGTRWLDAALIAWVALVALQRVPLPPDLRLRLSPALRAVDLQLRVDAPVVPGADTPHALSVNPHGTTLSLLVAMSVVLTFWSARTLFSGGGVRLAARAVAGMGLALAAFGIVQHTTAPHSFYGTTVPRQVTPFGPYSHQSLAGRLSISADSFDNRAMWLTTAAAAMAAALVVGLSRSGLIAAMAGLATLWVLSSARMDRRARAWLLGGFGGIVAVALAFVNTTAMAGRIGETIGGIGGRTAIWRATWPMAKDFWLIGIGAGAFERGMVVYQPSPHETFFNHAHNDYLQMLTEGGLLLAIPAIAAAAAGISGIRSLLRSDRSSMYWVRAGAASGLVAVAVQSIWETGLRVPANTLLFAVLSAISLHRPVNRP
jgi:O-antigen ligase